MACGPLLRVLAAEDGRRPRVVLRQLNELVLVADVQAAVADMRHDQVTVREERADDRRAHAEIVVVVLGEAIDPPVRQAHGGLEPIGLVRQRRVDPVRPGEIGRFVRSADEVLDRFDGNPGGDLAGRVSAHAVRDDEEPQVLRADEAVFVHVTNGAGFAQAECLHRAASRGVYHAEVGRYYFSGSSDSGRRANIGPKTYSSAPAETVRA